MSAMELEVWSHFELKKKNLSPSQVSYGLSFVSTCIVEKERERD